MRSRLDHATVPLQADVAERPQAEFRTMQRLAWTALLAALALFVAGLIFVPQLVTAALGGIVESRPTRADVIEGTVLYQPPAAPNMQRLPSEAEVAEGTRLRTDDRSRVFLSMPDGSTTLLYTHSDLAVQRMQFGRFNPAVQSTELRLFWGRANIGVALHPHEPERTIGVLAADARLDLAPGSFRLELDRSGIGQIAVRSGQATLWLGDQSFVLSAGQRARFGLEVGIQAPLPLEEALVKDGLLTLPIDGTVWQSFVEVEAGVAGSVTREDGHVRFHRRSEDGSIDRHGESGIVQTLDRDVRDFLNLRLSAAVRADYQSLSGGGTAGTEYPLMIRITYLDDQGREQIWGKGFYYQNDAGLSVKLGQHVEQAEWITYEQPDLLRQIRPTPVFLRRIEVLGSGWEYDSAVRQIELSGY